MNIRTSTIGIAFSCLLGAVACTSVTDDETPPADVATSQQGLSTGASSSGDVGSGTVGDTAEKPKASWDRCFSGCKQSHVSNGWCREYCDCVVYYKGTPRACEEYASGMYIDY
jgi:hypothetical protein